MLKLARPPLIANPRRRPCDWYFWLITPKIVNVSRFGTVKEPETTPVLGLNLMLNLASAGDGSEKAIRPEFREASAMRSGWSESGAETTTLAFCGQSKPDDPAAGAM